MKVYLDIDGVLLANDKRKALYAEQLIVFLTSKHDTYWLTTHCRGDAESAIDLLRGFFDPATVDLLKTIRSTNWAENKTEAIDFSEPFIWIDDDLFPEEEAELVKNECPNALAPGIRLT